MKNDQPWPGCDAKDMTSNHLTSHLGARNSNNHSRISNILTARKTYFNLFIFPYYVFLLREFNVVRFPMGSKVISSAKKFYNILR